MKKEKLKGYMRFAVPAVLTALAAALMISMPDYSARGVRNGLVICAQTVIPALFPFCVLSSFFVRSGLCSTLGKWLSPITRRIFALPGEAGGVMIMGLCGGFPVGASMAAQLLENGTFNRDEAGRLMLFCVNAGPAFVIGAVGAGMLGSAGAGVLLFCSLTAASLTVGILTRFMPRKEKNTDADALICVRPEPLSDALPAAVSQGTASTVSICAWVLLFSCLLEYVPLLGLSESTDILLGCLLEVTKGCAGAVKLKSLPVLAAALGWGGVSVHCQVMRYVRAAKVPMPQFLCARAVNSALAALICEGLLRLFPRSVQVFASSAQQIPVAFSFSAPAAAAMLFMGALLILEVDNRRKKC